MGRTDEVLFAGEARRCWNEGCQQKQAQTSTFEPCTPCPLADRPLPSSQPPEIASSKVGVGQDQTVSVRLQDLGASCASDYELPRPTPFELAVRTRGELLMRGHKGA